MLTFANPISWVNLNIYCLNTSKATFESNFRPCHMPRTNGGFLKWADPKINIYIYHYKSSKSMFSFSIVNHPFWGTSRVGNLPHVLLATAFPSPLLVFQQLLSLVLTAMECKLQNRPQHPGNPDNHDESTVFFYKAHKHPPCLPSGKLT